MVTQLSSSSLMLVLVLMLELEFNSRVLKFPRRLCF